MTNIKGTINPEFCKSLNEAIFDATTKTVVGLFGSKLAICQNKMDTDDATLLVSVTVPLMEGMEGIILRLVFDKQFLKTLVLGITSGTNSINDAVYEDAASELANIIGNKVKSFLNSHGFFIIMEHPVIETEEEIKEESDPKDRITELNLSLGESQQTGSPIIYICAKLRNHLAIGLEADLQ